MISAQEKINQINEEERSYTWDESEFPLRNATYEKLVPHKNLFDAGQDFMDKYEVWMHTQVGTFEPSDIDNDVAAIYKTILTLEKLFVDSPNTQKLTLDVSSNYVAINDCKLIIIVYRSKKLWMNLKLTCL